MSAKVPRLLARRTAVIFHFTAVDLPAHRGAFGESLACVGLLTHIRVVECVEKNIPAEEAVERLLQLIERCEAAG